MSSKLVKKGLDFVSSSNETSTKISKAAKGKNAKTPRGQKVPKQNKKKRPHDSPIKTSHQVGKKKAAKQVDFTEQNLKYFLGSSWKIKEETKEKIVHHRDRKHQTEQKEVTDNEDDEAF